MKNKEILKKAIEKAHNNGWLWHYKSRDKFSDSGWLAEYTLIGKNGGYRMIFDHDFAKAFWGEFIPGKSKMSWKAHLQQMVLAEEPLKYLEKYL